MMAWKMGLKTTYYLRSLGATAIEKSTNSSNAKTGSLGDTPKVSTLDAVGVSAPATPSAPAAPEFEMSATTTPEKSYSEEEKVMCSIMNGGACEACQ